MTKLTPRQLDVLRLLAEGCTEKAISRRLGISQNSVHTHCSRMLKAMEATCRAHAVALGYQQGILGTHVDVIHEVARVLHENQGACGMDDAYGDGCCFCYRDTQAIAQTGLLRADPDDLHRQLDSARAWAVHWQQEADQADEIRRETAATALQVARECDDLHADLSNQRDLVREADYRTEAMSTLLRGMARRVGYWRRESNHHEQDAATRAAHARASMWREVS